MNIDPVIGTEQEYQRLIKLAREQNTPIVRNLIPLHTGQGLDFLLASLGEEEYRNIYMTVEIKPEHWEYLPDPDDMDASAPVATTQVTRESLCRVCVCCDAHNVGVTAGATHEMSRRDLTV